MWSKRMGKMRSEKERRKVAAGEEKRNRQAQPE